jgi:hypothetical protein
MCYKATIIHSFWESLKKGMREMIKFLLSLSIAILFCIIGKAFAVDRLVTSYIISDVWYDNIFLIADKLDDMGTKNFTVQVGGGSELLNNFPNWYNDKFAPILFYEDISGDVLEDIIVVLISGSGVSLSTKEIHVLNQIHDPYRRSKKFKLNPLMMRLTVL